MDMSAPDVDIVGIMHDYQWKLKVNDFFLFFRLFFLVPSDCCFLDHRCHSFIGMWSGKFISSNGCYSWMAQDGGFLWNTDDWSGH